VSDAGRNSRPLRGPANSVSPTGATGRQSVKRGENRVHAPSPMECTGSKWLWAVSPKGHDPLQGGASNARLNRRDVDQAKWADRLAPKRGGQRGPADFQLTGRSPQRDPADSAALTPPKTDTRNEVTPALLSAWSITEQAAKPQTLGMTQAGRRAGWSKKQTLGRKSQDMLTWTTTVGR
jgi:hypothetical protein